MFWICDKANKNKINGSHLGNKNYCNQKFKNEQIFYGLHTGTHAYNFSIK